MEFTKCALKKLVWEATGVDGHRSNEQHAIVLRWLVKAINSTTSTNSMSMDHYSNKQLNHTLSCLVSHCLGTARVIGELDSSDIFCNSDYKHFLAQFGRITTLRLNPEGLVGLL
jgi:hypothetical protein